MDPQVVQRLLIPVSLLLGLFVLYERVQMELTRLSGAVYAAPEQILGGGTRAVALLTLLGAFGLLWWWRGQRLGWIDLSSGHELRWFLLLLAAAVSWPLLTMPFNFYHDQAYVSLRVLALVLLAGAWWRPLLLVPLTFVLSLLLWQLDQPQMGAGYIFPHKLHLLHVLNLAAVFLLVSLWPREQWQGRTPLLPFLLLVFCLVAAVYWQPAFAKWRIGWLLHGHLEHMPLAAYAHGWLAGLDVALVERSARVIAGLDLPLRLLTLGFESLFLLVLWRRRLASALLLIAVAFHCGVFLFYGYLFWTWMLLNLALFLLVRRLERRKDRQSDRGAVNDASLHELFGKWSLAVSIVLIAFSSYWCSPSQLAWFDARVSYSFRHEVLGSSGARYAVSPRFFEPYGDVFTMASFRFLVKDHATVAGPYATVNSRAMAEQVNRVTNLSDLLALEQTRMGRYNEKRAQVHADFLRQYFVHWNNSFRTDTSGIRRSFGRNWSPPQFWSAVQDSTLPEFTGQETVQEVIVRESTHLYDGAVLQEVRNIEVLRVSVL